MKIDKGPEKLSSLFNIPSKKPPAHEWQDFALKIISELGVPNFKRGSVFKICKEMSKSVVEKCFNDTKELCHSGAKWKYFFKLTSDSKNIKQPE